MARRPDNRRSPPLKRPTARRLAYDVLTEWEERRAAPQDGHAGAPHVTHLLDDALTRWSLLPQDRRLATELVYGVTRRSATLDALLAQFVSRPRSNTEPGLWRLLQLGVYQLVLLGGIPPHAAVSETVLLAKQLNQPRWAGFINGVLRNTSRELTSEFSDVPSRRGVPLSDASPEVDAAAPAVRYRQMAADVFPDPDTELAAYLAAAFSFPGWLIDRWLQRFDRDEALRLCAWYNSPGRMTLRTNHLRCDRDRLLAELQAEQIDASPGDLREAVRLARPLSVEQLPGFRDGWFSVQDESAQQAALLLDPQPGERILDLCAAPGGKTTHLAELLQDTGRIVACDVQPTRLARVVKNCQRLGLESVETCLISNAGDNIPEERFDAALVDVPCSNTGVLGKR
ncbi:MAG: hypothetical protein KDA75_20830, partial [Planctomycetaceae bacterium]|nr:hypothetical protein [Planctomycetaceae bacterium]